MPDRENRATYRYAADEQREIDALRRRYTSESPNNQLSAMRRIDHDVTRRATAMAVGFGLAGTLVMGLGLAMVLSFNWMIPGIILGCCGIAVMAAMPAAYERLLKRERKKVAPQIVELIKKAESSSREAP
ncbi:MAG: hypothetical protein IJ124_12780 [Clostridia bacterium]|nr:hypothetical protein [Clostridia bacterium]